VSRLRNMVAGAAVLTAVGTATVAVVGPFEGLRLKSYPDIVGVWTACYGETKGIRPGMVFTKPECDAKLVDSLVVHETGMRDCLDDPDAIPVKPYIAFVSLTYNIGVAAFCRSSVARRANAGDLQGACDAILMWDRAGGKQVRGLTLRRQKERQICIEGLP